MIEIPTENSDWPLTDFSKSRRYKCVNRYILNQHHFLTILFFDPDPHTFERIIIGLYYIQQKVKKMIIQ